MNHSELFDLFSELASHLDKELRRILSGSKLPPPQLAFATHSEILEYYSGKRNELESSFALTLLAMMEAWFQKDYRIRGTGKKQKDPLSKDLRKLYKVKKEKAHLVEEILESWKKHRAHRKQDIGQFRAMLAYRHWLAHGRYWVLKKGRPYSIDEIYLAVSAIYKHIPGL